DLPKAYHEASASMFGLPYGWKDLSAFVGLSWSSRGMFCSEFATAFLRAGGLPIFNDEPPREIAPFQFLESELLRKVWSDDVADDRQVRPAARDVGSVQP